MTSLSSAALPMLLLAGCAGGGEAVSVGNGNAAAAAAQSAAPRGQPFSAEPLLQFDQPWAMTFLPDGDYALVTEKPGRLKLWQTAGRGVIEVEGVPQVDAGGQGGLGDVVVHPDFRRNALVYLSWVEPGDGGRRGAVVGRAELVIDEMGEGRAQLRNLQVIWRQAPKMEGRGHYGHRIAFDPDTMLYISNGDRQAFDPAQDMGATLGKIVRLRDDGSVPPDNPFAARGGAAAQIWSLGHRNPLGLAFAPDGRLWSHEMGPAGGDEMNLIERGSNYGYPIVSNGDHYDGRPIPDHGTRPEFNAPDVTWTPVISPSSMIFYTGSAFPGWRGNALIGALSGQALVRVAIAGDRAREVARYPMGARIREVEQGPDGAIYLLEDTRGGRGGRLLRLTPAR